MTISNINTKSRHQFEILLTYTSHRWYFPLKSIPKYPYFTKNGEFRLFSNTKCCLQYTQNQSDCVDDVILLLKKRQLSRRWLGECVDKQATLPTDVRISAAAMTIGILEVFAFVCAAYMYEHFPMIDKFGISVKRVSHTVIHTEIEMNKQQRKCKQYKLDLEAVKSVKVFSLSLSCFRSVWI